MDTLLSDSDFGAEVFDGRTQPLLEIRPRFPAEQLAREPDVGLTDLRVDFYDGSRQDIPVGTTVPGGGCTTPIDLTGAQRSIKGVRMHFEPSPASLRVEAR